MIVRTGKQATVVETRPTNTLREEPPNQLDESLAVAEQWVGKHPALCVGLALMVGVVLGWWIKRR